MILPEYQQRLIYKSAYILKNSIYHSVKRLSFLGDASSCLQINVDKILQEEANLF